MLREIRLAEFVKLVPDDEIILVRKMIVGKGGLGEYDWDDPEKNEVLFEGDVSDFWKMYDDAFKEESAMLRILNIMSVVMARPAEDPDIYGPVMQIVVR